MRAAGRRYYASHKKQIYEKNKKRRLANPQRHAAETMRYYRANLEKVRERQRRFRKEHKEKVNKWNRRWRAANAKKENKRIAAWAKANPLNRAISRGHRRAAKRGNGGSHTVAEWIALCWAASWQCTYCAKVLDVKTAHRDHKIPIARGGSDGIDNITPACVTCNSRKNRMTDVEFNARRETA